MKITETKITVEELFRGYSDNGEEGVSALVGKLNIRPPYQREFVYKDKQQAAVIESILQGFPLSIIYWAKTGEDTYEVLDGQQRILSICHYLASDFGVNYIFFHNLEDDQREKVLNYELTVCICDGDGSEKLSWFERINTQGEVLTKQELRNAVYHGEWLTECKRRFSKTGGPAVSVGGDYMSGSPIRQDYLQAVLDWISDGNIEEYMAKNQKSGDYNELWNYFNEVIRWVKNTFPETLKGVKTYAKDLKKVAWGRLYNKYGKGEYDTSHLRSELSRLMLDDEVTKTSGVFEYLLSKEEKHLNIRTFSDKQKSQMYNRQGGICASCGQAFSLKEMEGDHVLSWSSGGKTTLDNGQMICRKCNRSKGSRV